MLFFVTALASWLGRAGQALSADDFKLHITACYCAMMLDWNGNIDVQYRFCSEQWWYVVQRYTTTVHGGWLGAYRQSSLLFDSATAKGARQLFSCFVYFFASRLAAETSQKGHVKSTTKTIVGQLTKNLADTVTPTLVDVCVFACYFLLLWHRFMRSRLGTELSHHILPPSNDKFIQCYSALWIHYATAAASQPGGLYVVSHNLIDSAYIYRYHIPILTLFCLYAWWIFFKVYLPQHSTYWLRCVMKLDRPWIKLLSQLWERPPYY